MVLPEEMFGSIGLTLKLLRKRRGWRQEDLAGRVGMSKTQVSKYETGGELPKLESLGRLLAALEVQLDGFFAMVASVHRLGEEGLAGIPGTASPSVDEAFKSVYRTLLEHQRAVVREELSGTARFLAGNRPENRGDARNRGKDAL